ncbi:unnamed protein product [Rotaria sp. Silwood2]|nr:unnamed protein product [Rotaria sp. Silwood2]CAF4215191.1 unnamed protein product [Rotaria sp. Silwood2]CAF4448549.1 unnamed protein product [Rotaria sp. Silwood2]
MPSPATHYRRRNNLLRNNYLKTAISPSNLSRNNTTGTSDAQQFCDEKNDSMQLNPATVITNKVDLNESSRSINRLPCTFNGRFLPTSRDIAVAAMIYKVRRLQNNKDIDSLCKLFNALSINLFPKSMKAIQQQLHPGFDINKFYKFYTICSNCGAYDSNSTFKCKSCNDDIIFKFYVCSIKQQIQQLLSMFGFFSRLKEEKINNMNLFSSTKYGEILREIETNAFTLMISFDGVSTGNNNLSLWPFTIIFNELPIPERRYLENILIAGIIPTGKKPTNYVVQRCLQLICEQLIKLELGQEFFINDLDQRAVLHFYNIASCSDKPAEALLANVVPYNAEYGCPKCFHAGESYRGQRRSGANTVSFTIRVYPFVECELRTQEKCAQIVEQLTNRLNQINNNSSCIKKKTVSKKTVLKKTTRKKKKKIAHYGHIVKLKFFHYGTSFLTDSLHTIYAGAFKQLLNLLFHSAYRNESWSLFEKITHIDESLTLVQTPSTTQRRFRSLKIINKYKGSEYRCLFHFGLTSLVRHINDIRLKNLLFSLVTAINLASSNYVTDETIEIVEKLLHYFVQHFQEIFGLRHMSSNIHSLLHVHQGLSVMGPLWFYSTFSFEGIDKDLVSTVHGTTEFAKQLIRQHILYRDSLILHKHESYPSILFTFNEELLDRKQLNIHHRKFVDSCVLSNPVSKDLYDTSENGIATRVQSLFNDDLIFYHSLTISGVLIKTTVAAYGKLVADSCISFSFIHDEVKYGLIRAIVQSKKNTIPLFIEGLVEIKPGTSKIKFNISNDQYQVPNILRLKPSNIFYLKHPKFILKKNACICEPGNRVTVLEFPNLKDNS